MLFRPIIVLLCVASSLCQQTYLTQGSDGMLFSISNLANSDLICANLCNSALNDTKTDLANCTMELEIARNSATIKQVEGTSNLTPGEAAGDCSETESRLRERDELILEIRSNSSSTIEELQHSLQEMKMFYKNEISNISLKHESEVRELQQELFNVTRSNSEFTRRISELENGAKVPCVRIAEITPNTMANFLKCVVVGFAIDSGDEQPTTFGIDDHVQGDK